MEIAISSGHGLRVRGAKGFIDEVDENRRVTDRVAALLKGAGHFVHVFHDNNSSSVSQNLGAIVAWHNRQKRDRDVSVHFNAFKTTSAPRGTEVLFVSQSTLAASVSRAMANAAGFINRGAKKRTDLSFLNRTNKPAILLEVAFVDSSADVGLYRQHFERICRALAESIGGKALGRTVEPTQEPEPLEPPQGPLIPEISEENIADITIAVKGDCCVILNGDPIVGEESQNRLELVFKRAGDILVNVNGEDFQIAGA